MFEKLYLLVKNNAGTAVINNPVIPEKNREAVINDASSSIIEVLKGQVEGGKLKDLINNFKFTGAYNNPLINNVERKFANKLNNYYQIAPAEAMNIAKALIQPTMQELIKQSKSEQNKEFALSSLIQKVSGNHADALLRQLAVA
ncbi:MAG: hypothetical protein ACTHNW_16675 [Mucilaginibacter sp.]